MTSDPPGAQVWVDLRPTDTRTNGRLESLSSGKHSVMVKLDTLECDPTAQVIDVRKGRTDTVRFRLLAPHALRHVAETPPITDKLPSLPPVQTPVSPPESTPHTGAIKPQGQPEPLPQTHAQPTEVVEPQSTTGVLEVAASLPGAKVFVNDQEQPQTTPASLRLPAGTYVVRVELTGYTSDPADQTVSMFRSSPLQSIYFALNTQNVASELAVETAPIAGKILINSVPVGDGKVAVSRDFGSYTVSFGDSAGWKTPDPIHISITPTQPRPSVRGLYVRLFHAAAEVDGSKPVASGGVRWQLGAYFEDDGAHPSAALGPKIRQIPESGKFGWELAEGDPNRNPVGGDYIEFTFALPPDADPKSPLTLRLYLYRSSRRYAFSLTGKAEVVVTVNGHTFLDGYRPTYTTQAADEERYEEWSLSGALVRGENRVMIRSGEHNSLFNYLWKMEIR